MRTSLRTWEESLPREDEWDLGEGLSEPELFYWADRKREQNFEHFVRGHELCAKCKNCLCGRRLRYDSGFRCLCDFGKKLVTPYRVRFMSDRERELHQARRIYCIQHGIYEPKGQPCV